MPASKMIDTSGCQTDRATQQSGPQQAYAQSKLRLALCLGEALCREVAFGWVRAGAELGAYVYPSIHRHLRMILCVYVDSNMAGPEVNMNRARPLSLGVIAMDEPTLLGTYLGCGHDNIDIVGALPPCSYRSLARRIRPGVGLGALAHNMGQQVEECHAYGAICMCASGSIPRGTCHRT